MREYYKSETVSTFKGLIGGVEVTSRRVFNSTEYLLDSLLEVKQAVIPDSLIKAIVDACEDFASGTEFEPEFAEFEQGISTLIEVMEDPEMYTEQEVHAYALGFDDEYRNKIIEELKKFYA